MNGVCMYTAIIGAHIGVVTDPTQPSSICQPSPPSVLLNMVSAMHTQKGSINQNLHIDLVRVDGWYRIGKLLGAGGSGMTNSGSTLTLCSELSRDGLCRERYQDGN